MAIDKVINVMLYIIYSFFTFWLIVLYCTYERIFCLYAYFPVR